VLDVDIVSKNPLGSWTLLRTSPF